MVIEQDISPFFEWLFSGNQMFGALGYFIMVVAAGTLFGVFLSFLIVSFRHGPNEAFYVVFGVIAKAFGDDLPNTSPRRILAIARIALQEAIRNKVLIAFAIFLVAILFAGWFLDVSSDHPARLYLSFVLTSSNFLVVVLALFISAFSLPTDIKNRTIYTIVTKPVRPGEIVLGRVFGFLAIGSVILFVMFAISYGFVVRGLDHDHEITEAQVVDLGKDANGQHLGWDVKETSLDAHHRHSVRIGPDGVGETNYVAGHTHTVRRIEDEHGVRFEVSEPRDMLQARVPVYAKELRFLSRDGEPSNKGINVGNEWMYRSYIEGGSQAAAIWTFENIKEEDYPDGLPLELTIRVFRTYKGFTAKDDEIARIHGAISLNNPDPSISIQSAPRIFESEEYSTQQIVIPRKLKSRDDREIDLFKDLVDKQGRLEIGIQCIDRNQYFGVAKADCYLRAAERPFWWNFMKGYLSLWFQMVMVTTFGVMFSTFLSGPVALLATISSVMTGYFAKEVSDLFAEKTAGGGPFESLIRTIGQSNMTTELEIGEVSTAVIEYSDRVILFVMTLISTISPDYRAFDTARWVAYGYNIPGELVAQHGAQVVAYLLCVSVIGYFFLKTREIAAT